MPCFPVQQLTLFKVAVQSEILPRAFLTAWKPSYFSLPHFAGVTCSGVYFLSSGHNQPRRSQSLGLSCSVGSDTFFVTEARPKYANKPLHILRSTKCLKVRLKYKKLYCYIYFGMSKVSIIIFWLEYFFKFSHCPKSSIRCMSNCAN